MWSELKKKKMLAAAASYQLLRIAVVLPDVAVYGLSQIPGDPSQRLRPTYCTAPMAITHQAHSPGFVLISSVASQWQARTRPQNQRKREGRLLMEMSAKEFSLLSDFHSIHI